MLSGPVTVIQAGTEAQAAPGSGDQCRPVVMGPTSCPGARLPAQPPEEGSAGQLSTLIRSNSGNI